MLMVFIEGPTSRFEAQSAGESNKPLLNLLLSFYFKCYGNCLSCLAYVIKDSIFK